MSLEDQLAGDLRRADFVGSAFIVLSWMTFVGGAAMAGAGGWFILSADPSIWEIVVVLLWLALCFFWTMVWWTLCMLGAVVARYVGMRIDEGS